MIGFLLIMLIVFGTAFVVGAMLAAGNAGAQATEGVPKKVSKDYVPEKVGAPELWGD